MPVNALKTLLEHPNPVPMERWLTIGVLNPRVWKTTLGAQWTQRAGTVHVSHPGDGFGGRALCLWHAAPPSESFSASVTVWLSDEAGAAGLAFCADEENRHYGFYPTGGKFRLTRFDGPDVFSWKVLREFESDGYRPGDWNTLRVEVRGDQIRCFVNERQVVEVTDSGFRGGRSGLCKFRGTVASFKGFQVGEAGTDRKTETVQSGDLERVLGDFLKGNAARGEAVARF
jgi:hypothetical protein